MVRIPLAYIQVLVFIHTHVMPVVENLNPHAYLQANYLIPAQLTNRNVMHKATFFAIFYNQENPVLMFLFREGMGI